MRQRLRQQLANFLKQKRGTMTFAQTGVSPSSLQRMEAGEQNVSLDTLEQLAKRLRCDPRDLLS